MAKNSASKTSLRKKAAPRSLALAQRGISTGSDFAGLMSALMSDLIEGKVDGQVGNAVCNAGGKLLKVVEMQHKYGAKATGSSMAKALQLAPLVPESVQ